MQRDEETGGELWHGVTQANCQITAIETRDIVITPSPGSGYVQGREREGGQSKRPLDEYLLDSEDA